MNRVLQQRWIAPLTFAILAVAWTWPAAVSPDVVGRHADAVGTVWFIDAAPRLGWRGADPLTGWPAGATYGRPDSFLLWLLSLLLGWLPSGGLPPARVHAWIGVIGVTLSAWAAEAFARALGAVSPWSLLAGLAFGFCGLAGTALLEGYVYHLLDPWLPLLGLWWWRATGPDGRPRDGVLAGVFFLLTLLTSAYLGVAAVVLVAVLWLARRPLPVSLSLAQQLSMSRSSREWLARCLPSRPELAALGVVVPGLTAYLVMFLNAAGDHGVEVGGGPIGQQLGRTLVRMTGPTAETDLSGISQSPALLGVLPALVVVAPVVLRGLKGWQPVALAGVVGGALAFLPRFDPEALAAIPGGELLAALVLPLIRFPDRLGWTWQVAGGAVAALVLTELGRTRPRGAALILAAAIIEPFAISAVPWRQGTTPAASPSAYQAHTGPVLDLWPEDVFDAPRWYLRSTNTACYHQTIHGRPIADHCVFTPGIRSPREALTAWMIPRLIDGEVASVSDTLSRLGFGSVVLHLDAFRESDRRLLRAALGRIDPEAVESTDGGEHVLAFAVPDPADAAEARAAWAAAVIELSSP